MAETIVQNILNRVGFENSWNSLIAKCYLIEKHYVNNLYIILETRHKQKGRHTILMTMIFFLPKTSERNPMIGLHRNWSAENMEPSIPINKKKKIIIIITKTAMSLLCFSKRLMCISLYDM